MGLNPITIEQFPGLDLRQDPGDSRGAIDMANVVLSPGRVRTRDGYSSLFTAPAAVYYLAFTLVGNGVFIVASSGSPGTFTAININGVSNATWASGGTINVTGASGVSFGTPGASAFYVASSGGVLVKWNGSVFSNVAGVGSSTRTVLISPTDNRLVLCDQADKVWFSDPGAPETFGANNFVRLSPGDGEAIVGGAMYNNQMFVFKDTKFYVFYGNTTDSTGNPVFNYRAVHGVGALGDGSAAPGACCAGPDGVYFVAKDGIYRTTGGSPTKISLPLQPFFDGTTGPFWSSGAFDYTTYRPTLSWSGDCLYASLPKSGGLNVFVWDRTLNAWYAWPQNMSALAWQPSQVPVGSPTALVAGVGTAVVKMTSGLTTDAGAAIVSRYRLPFETYGNPREKRIRETILEGTGTPTVQWSKDWGSLVTGSAVALGTAPAIGTGRQRLAIRGRAFSLQLGAASGAWSVNRVRPNLGEGLRGPEVTV